MGFSKQMSNLMGFGGDGGGGGQGIAMTTVNVKVYYPFRLSRGQAPNQQQSIFNRMLLLQPAKNKNRFYFFVSSVPRASPSPGPSLCVRSVQRRACALAPAAQISTAHAMSGAAPSRTGGSTTASRHHLASI